MNGWPSGGLAEWREGGATCLSVVFSWQVEPARRRADKLLAAGERVRVGGPAVALRPELWRDFADVGGSVAALGRHNPAATRTTRGCVRRCGFSAAPRLEGDLVELTDWEPRPVVCDNNLLGASRRHFDRVIDRLKSVPGVDFNQGLDARLLTGYQAERLRELDLYAVRLAWDSTAYETEFRRAYETLRRAGLPARKIRVYVLIGYRDTPEDALYRLEAVRALGSRPNPMRYQPLDAPVRNGYVAPGWSEGELRRMMRYFSRLRWLEHVPYAEYGRPA